MDNPEVKTSPVLSRAWVDAYERVAAKAQLVRDILARRGVRLRDGSALSQLLKQADILSREWAAQRVVDMRVLAEAAHVNRLADSIAALSDEPGIQEALRRMAGGVMQPDNRDASQGKDALWEMALLADLSNAGLSAKAAEPDIVVDFGMGEYPIACKKIWSEKGVEGHVSKGAKQLASFGNRGIIALNLDDLAPAGRFLHDQNGVSGMQFLDAFNMDFVSRHRRVLQRAIMAGKCDGFILSTTTTAVLSEEAEPFNLVTQTSLWHLQEGAADGRERFLAFAQAHRSANEVSA
ncbi:hypothetical protein [Sinorhizobium medicae]|uniref:Uncharacterized protein n=1 Tax=Sinorhizobium medicae TaxID=110321 RepID=A0A508WP78_9HYPH|nr:hypothetical protein [Sinorhizobium medicae]VTZ59308.1 conserved hypothetical protein [Sinorhizobium medicae]